MSDETQEYSDETLLEAGPASETTEETSQEAVSQTETEVVEAARVRAIAEAQGWRPDGKLNPVEFLEAIPKYSEGLVNKLRTAEERIERLSKVVGKQMTDTAEREREAAKQRLIDATERGDAEAALKASADLHKEAPKIEDTPTDAQSKVKAWTESPEQAWFQTNPEMAQDAAAFYDAEMRKLGRDDPDAILPIVNNKIKKLYPERFQNANRQQSSTSAPTQAARVVSQTRRAPDLSSTGLDAGTIAQYKAMGLTDKDILDSANSMRSTYGR